MTINKFNRAFTIIELLIVIVIIGILVAISAVSSREFLQYVDFAPFIDKYGLKEYTIEYTLRSASVANRNIIQAYFQNGSGTKYDFFVINTVEETDNYFKKKITPYKISSQTETRAMLAFYGTYDTGNKPIVSNVRFYLAE